MKQSTEFNKFEADISSERLDLESIYRHNNGTLEKLELERNLLNSTLSIKEREILNTEDLVLKKLPLEFSNFEFLYKKEVEIYNKMKLEHGNFLQKNDLILKEVKEMLKIYKEIANIDIKKTEEGFLKIFFYNLNNFSKECYLTIEIKGGNYKIINVYPAITNINILEEELQITHNFSLFICKLVNTFITFFSE